MARNRSKRGLCSACKCDEQCLHTTSGDSPVLQCEEFQACDCVPSKAPAKRSRCLPDRETVLAAEEGVEAKGLCTNCENKRACTFAKSPGGVWHCIEYR
jgi:hypothetical protein